MPELGMSASSSGSSPSLTHFDAFGLTKRYPSGKVASRDPDSIISSHDLYDSTHHLDGDDEEESTRVTQREESVVSSQTTNPEGPTTSQASSSEGSIARSQVTKPKVSSSSEKPKQDPLFAPFPNRSSFELGEWFYGQGPQKSIKDFKGLIGVLTSPTFSLDDIQDTKWTSAFSELGKNKEELPPSKSQWIDDSGWKTTEVEIEIPIHSRMAQGHGVEKRVAGTLHHRSVVSILEEKVRNAPASRLFHLDGHELLWKPGDSETSPEFRVLSELYNSDAFLSAQREIRENTPPEIKDCKLPRVAVGLMFWSDATHLSTFSTSKLWPLYMLFGNDSKYGRGKGASDPCYHVAYFDTVSSAVALSSTHLDLPFVPALRQL